MAGLGVCTKPVHISLHSETFSRWLVAPPALWLPCKQGQRSVWGKSTRVSTHAVIRSYCSELPPCADAPGSGPCRQEARLCWDWSQDLSWGAPSPVLCRASKGTEAVMVMLPGIGAVSLARRVLPSMSWGVGRGWSHPMKASPVLRGANDCFRTQSLWQGGPAGTPPSLWAVYGCVPLLVVVCGWWGPTGCCSRACCAAPIARVGAGE